MHLNPGMLIGGAVVGLLVGLTGAGGGALMTPMLILFFGVNPATAISSDLVASFLMRPVGAAVHLKRGTVSLRMVGWLALGSVPAAFLGSYLLRAFGMSRADQRLVELALGLALLAGAGAMVVRSVLDRRAAGERAGSIAQVAVRPVPTVLIGATGGLIVGLTSVGAGSLMIVLLLFVYPMIGAGQLVGTDLTQAIPLTAAAALGALIFGHVQFAVTASVAVGSIPAVLAGSLLSSRAPDRYIRPLVMLAIFASGLKYVGVPTTALGWTIVAVAGAGITFWTVTALSRRARPQAPRYTQAAGYAQDPDSGYAQAAGCSRAPRYLQAPGADQPSADGPSAADRRLRAIAVRPPRTRTEADEAPTDPGLS